MHMRSTFLLALIFLGLFSCSKQPVKPEMATNQHQEGAQKNLDTLVQHGHNTLLTHTKQFTFEGRRTGEAYFNKDASKIIMQSEREPGNPFYQIYVMDLITGKTNRVSTGKGNTTCAWIHPNNKTVMFSSTHLDPQTDQKTKLALENRQAGKEKKYSWSYDENYDIFSGAIDGKGKLKRLTFAKGYDAEGSYSPDGQWIAFASNRSAYIGKLSPEDQKYFDRDQSYMMDIYIMRADGSEVTQLTHSKGYDGGPFFSADGKKITWRRFSADGMSAEIYTMNTDGSDQKRLTKLDSMSWAPYFHPSGDYLIFTTNIHGYKNFELYIVDAMGAKKPVRVTFEEGFDGLPVFTPDGKHVAWTRKPANSDESQIYIGDWDDHQARALLGLPEKTPLLAELSPAIDERDIKNHVYYLASPELLGRYSGSDEEQKYMTEYAQIFKQMGLAPAGDKGSYFQIFEFTSGVKLGKENHLVLTINENSTQHAVGNDWLPTSYSANGSFPKAVVSFVGYGINVPASDKFPGYNSYTNIDVKDKWVMMFRHLPENISVEQRTHMNLYSKVQYKVSVAKQLGAAGVIIVNGPNSGATKSLPDFEYEGSLADSSIPVISITDSLAEKILAPTELQLKELQDKLDSGKETLTFDIKASMLASHIEIIDTKSTGINLLAKWDLGKSQSLMIGAHGDHLGKGKKANSLMDSSDKTDIHFGADDNASGVAGIMELAHYFSSLSKKEKSAFKQNIVFAIWSGEELGLLGSHYFVKNWKEKKSLDKSITSYLNMDMIGRYRQALNVQGTGSAEQWDRLLESSAINHQLNLALIKDPYVPSDAMALYLGNIPSITFFTGSHSEYHSPRDTALTLNYSGSQKVVSFVADVASKLASMPNGLTYQKMKDTGSGGSSSSSRKFRIYLGTIPDYAQKGVKGVRISGTKEGGPAHKVGIQAGDVVVEISGKPIENLYDYVQVLEVLKPNVETTMTILRNNEKMKLNITPTAK